MHILSSVWESVIADMSSSHFLNYVYAFWIEIIRIKKKYDYGLKNKYKGLLIIIEDERKEGKQAILE